MIRAATTTGRSTPHVRHGLQPLRAAPVPCSHSLLWHRPLYLATAACAGRLFTQRDAAGSRYLEHLRRAWTVVIDAVHKRQAGLAAVLAEGRLESLEGDELVIKFPAGFGFQADQVTRGSNPQVITAVLRELTGRDLRVTTRLTAESAPAAAPEEDARILSKDELLRVLKQEFDARLIDDGPTR
jgi:hypothetical protein